MIRYLKIIAVLALATGSVAQQPASDSALEAEKPGPGVTYPKIKTTVAVNDEDMQSRGISGGCSLVLVVDEKGVPRNVRVLRCSQPSLAVASEKSVMQSHYTPAIKDGVPVAAKIRYRVDFHVGRETIEEPESSPCTNPVSRHSRLSYAFRPPPGEATSTPDANGVYAFSGTDTAPSITKLSDEKFCDTAEFEAPSSKCNGVLTIDGNGNLQDLQSPNCSIEKIQEPFVASLRKSQFAAGRIAGKPVSMRVFFFLDFDDQGPAAHEPAKP